jgi:hypothetical protein
MPCMVSGGTVVSSRDHQAFARRAAARPTLVDRYVARLRLRVCPTRVNPAGWGSPTPKKTRRDEVAIRATTGGQVRAPRLQRSASTVERWTRTVE